MAKQNINIQDGFLFQSLKAGSQLTVELVNGRKLEGRMRRFDRFALILETEGREVMIYKHAVATISTTPTES